MALVNGFRVNTNTSAYNTYRSYGSSQASLETHHKTRHLVGCRTYNPEGRLIAQRPHPLPHNRATP